MNVRMKFPIRFNELDLYSYTNEDDLIETMIELQVAAKGKDNRFRYRSDNLQMAP